MGVEFLLVKHYTLKVFCRINFRARIVTVWFILLQSPIQCIGRVPSVAIRWPKRQANPTPPSTVRVKNACGYTNYSIHIHFAVFNYFLLIQTCTSCHSDYKDCLFRYDVVKFWRQIQKWTASRFRREQFSCFYSVSYNFLHPVPPSWRQQPIWICPSAHAGWTPTLHRIPPNPQNECLFYFTSLFKQRRLNSFAKEGSNFTGMFFILSERSFVKSFQYSDWSRGGGRT